MSLTTYSSLKVFEATWDPSLAAGVKGMVSFSIRSPTDYDFSYQLNFTDYSGPTCNLTNGLSYHIHSYWDDSAASGKGASCAPNMTGGHYDPRLACNNATNEQAACIAANKTSSLGYTYLCTPEVYHANPSACEVGDLSGKFGKIYPYNTSNTFTDTIPPLISDYMNPSGHIWSSIVIHCGSTRISCAHIVEVIPISTLINAAKDKAGMCFSGSESVSLESGATIPISEVSVGDRVLSANAQGQVVYSDVVAVPHKKNDQLVNFIHITLSNHMDIKMTPDHLVLASTSCDSQMSLLSAADIKVNECLQTVDGQSRVVSKTLLQARGIYTLVTQEEFIVVNGIIASPFAVNHAVASAFYSVHRMLYSLIPSLTVLSSTVSQAVAGLFMAMTV
jgi:hypothetical protein